MREQTQHAYRIRAHNRHSTHNIDDTTGEISLTTLQARMRACCFHNMLCRMLVSTRDDARARNVRTRLGSLRSSEFNCRQEKHIWPDICIFVCMCVCTCVCFLRECVCVLCEYAWGNRNCCSSGGQKVHSGLPRAQHPQTHINTLICYIFVYYFLYVIFTVYFTRILSVHTHCRKCFYSILKKS